MAVSSTRTSNHDVVVRSTNAGACVFSIDAAGSVRRWTRDAELMFGYTRESAERLFVARLAPFLSDPSNGPEGWCRRVDGSVFRGLVAELSVADEPRDREALQALVITDITSRYLREQALSRVRERIDEVTASVAHLAFFSVDYMHDEVDVWGAFSEVTGWRHPLPPRRLGELMQLVHPADRERARVSFEDAVATGAAFELELRMQGDLGARWLRMAGSLVESQPPRIVGAALAVDSMGAALQLNQAKLDAVLDATTDGIMTVDSQGVVESINQTGLAMFRCVDRTRMLGTRWNTWLDVGSERLPSSGTLQDAVGCRADGSTFAMECGFSAIEVDAQRLSIVTMRDLTQRRLLERQLLDVSEQLQRQIGQDLHDGLGQLLTGTAFLTKGLQHSLATEHQPQAQRIVELINLAIARVRSLARGLSPIHVEAQSLEAVLRHTVSEASELLGVECDLRLDDYVDTAQPTAIAQLCLIAREAITNAVRHGHAQRIVVHLTRVGDQSVLSLEDDGVGIGEIDKPLEGLGLRSMRYRAKMIGGKLDVVRTRTGTTVRCCWRDA